MGKTDKERIKMSVLPDTNIFIEYFRGSQASKDYIQQLLSKKEEIYFSAITESELLAGKSYNDSKRKEIVLHILSLFNKIHVDNKVAQLAGDLRRQYYILIPDAIIAASAFLSNSTLITKNLKDFKKVKDLSVKSPY